MAVRVSLFLFCCGTGEVTSWILFNVVAVDAVVDLGFRNCRACLARRYRRRRRWYTFRCLHPLHAAAIVACAQSSNHESFDGVKEVVLVLDVLEVLDGLEVALNCKCGGVVVDCAAVVKDVEAPLNFCEAQPFAMVEKFVGVMMGESGRIAMELDEEDS